MIRNQQPSKDHAQQHGHTQADRPDAHVTSQAQNDSQIHDVVTQHMTGSNTMTGTQDPTPELERQHLVTTTGYVACAFGFGDTGPHGLSDRPAFGGRRDGVITALRSQDGTAPSA